MGDTEYRAGIDQQGSLQTDNSAPDNSDPLINVIMPSPAGELEVERVSGNPIEGDQSPKRIIEDNMVEWEDVQSLLSNMGIQLTRDTSTTSSVGKLTNVKKKRGKREL